MSTGLIVVGTIADGVTQNPILLGVISGSGLFFKDLHWNKKIFRKKIELCRFASTGNEKVLMDLRCFMRGKSYDDQDSLSQLKVLDDIIIDIYPLVKKFDDSCSQKFTSE